MPTYLRPVLAAVVALACVLGLLSLPAWAQAPEEGAGADVMTHTVSVCGLVSAWGETSREPHRIAHSRAMAQAVADVNNGDCTILGPGCEERISWPGGRLHLNFSLWELDGSTRSTPSAFVRCVEEGSEVVVGPTLTPQTESAMLLANVYELPIVGYSASSTLFSKRDPYANYARTMYSNAVLVRALAHLFHSLGWRQVAVIYKATAFGYSLSEAMVTYARECNISVETISVGADATASDEMLEAALEQLEGIGHKVVALLITPVDIVNLLLAADARGMNTSSFVWSTHRDAVRAYQQIGSFLAPEAEETMWRVLAGMISPSYEERGQDTLLMEHMEAAQPSAEVVNNYLKNVAGTGSAKPALTPITEGEFQESGNWIENSLPALTAYDAIWLVAEGWARAVRTMNAAGRPSTGDFMREVTSPGSISFFGASGICEWDSNGDRVGDHLTVYFSNQPPGAAQLRDPNTTIVGSFRPGEGLVLDEDNPIRWPDGTFYPTIPSDGSLDPEVIIEKGTSSWRAVAISVGVVASVLIPLLAYLAVRIRDMKHMVSRIVDESTQALDLESPLSKMLSMLERLATGEARLRPSKEEAAELRLLVAAHVHNLAAPVGIREQLANFNAEVAEYLARMSDTSRSTCIIANPTLASAPRPSLEYGGGDEASMLDLVVLPADETPDNIRNGLGHDLFLDFVTGSSPVRKEAASPLAAVMQQAMHLFDLFPVLGTQDAANKLLRYALALERGYSDTGYHCRMHAADVTCRLATILQMTGIGCRSARLAALVAAAMHDYEHPLLNNVFLVKQGSHMAKAFNDQAVAENHSLRAGLALLESDALNFTAMLRSSGRNAAPYHAFRRTVIQLVLGTEMSRHFDIVGRFNARIASNLDVTLIQRGNNKWKAMDDEDQLLTLQTAIKVSDLGHCALPWEQHQAWLRLLQDEMFAQGDQEKRLGMDVSPLMDRNKPGVSAPESQLGFFDVFALPLFSSFAKVFPECQPLLDQAQSNYQRWGALVNSRRRLSAPSMQPGESPTHLPLSHSNRTFGLRPWREHW